MCSSSKKSFLKDWQVITRNQFQNIVVTSQIVRLINQKNGLILNIRVFFSILINLKKTKNHLKKNLIEQYTDIISQFTRNNRLVDIYLQVRKKISTKMHLIITSYLKLTKSTLIVERALASNSNPVIN